MIELSFLEHGNRKEGAKVEWSPRACHFAPTETDSVLQTT